MGWESLFFSGTHVAVGSGRVSLRSRKPVVVWCGFHALLVSFRLGTRQAAARHAGQTGPQQIGDPECERARA